MIDLEAIRARNEGRKKDADPIADQLGARGALFVEKPVGSKVDPLYLPGEWERAYADVDELLAEVERLNIEAFAIRQTMLRGAEERQDRIEERLNAIELLLPPKCQKCGWMFETRKQLAEHLIQFADKPCVIPYS